MIGAGVQPFVDSAFAQIKRPNSSIQNQLPSAKPKSQIKLITSGVQPRKLLRFTPKPGQKETADMQMDMDMSMSMNGNPTPSFEIPGTSFKLNTVIKKVESNGDIHYDFSYSKVDLVGKGNLPPKALEDMRREIKKIEGIKGNVIVDNMGRTKKANFVIPKNFNPGLKQMMDQMTNSIEQLSAQVPEEAIGKGAKWEVTSPISFNGINFQQTAIYELVNFQNDVATLNVSFKQQAPGSQKITLPEIPKGMTMTMQSYNSTGQGQATIGMNRIMPLSTSLNMNTSTQMLVDMPNPNASGKMTTPRQMRMNQEISTKLKIQSK